MFKLFLFCSLAAVALGAAIPENETDETDNYIVGGSNIKITEVPYIASMQNHNGHHFCGGAILSPTTIVTAAHCCINKSPSKVVFRVGSEWRVKHGHLVQAKSIHVHPKFSLQTMDFDVAVVELATPLRFSEKVKPISLIKTEPDSDSEHVRASGWGHLQENGNVADHLQSVLLAMVDRDVCADNLKDYVPITSRMICAGQKGKDSCQGDSGGPLVSDGHLAGLVSFGVGCARDKRPGVYTNVADPEITKFIKKYSKDSM